MPNTALFPSRSAHVAIWMNVIDGYPEETHEATTSIGGAPLEDGAFITDHAFNEPRRLRLLGWVSGRHGHMQAHDAYQELMRSRDSLEPIAVVTALDFYPEMLVERVRAPKRMPGLQLDITLKEIQRAEVIEEPIPPPPGSAGGIGGPTARVNTILGQEREARMLQPGDPHSQFNLPSDFAARELDAFTGGEPMGPGDPYHFGPDDWSQDIDPYLRSLLAKKVPRDTNVNADYDVPPPALQPRTVTGPASDPDYDVPLPARADRTVTGPASDADYDVGPSESYTFDLRGRPTSGNEGAASRAAELARLRLGNDVGNAVAGLAGAVLEGFGIGSPAYTGTGKLSTTRAIDEPFSYNGLMPDIGGQHSTASQRRLPSQRN